MKVKVGDLVWFHKYGNTVAGGKIIDIIDDSRMSLPALACVRHDRSFETIEIDSRKMYLSVQEATLALAERKQQQASALLSEAAGLFKNAGGMKEDAKAEAPSN